MYKIQIKVKNIYMKVLIIVSIIICLISITSVRVKIYKEINDNLKVYLIITKSIRVKINLTNIINKQIKNYLYDTSSQEKAYDIKQAIETFRYHKELIKGATHIFNGNIVYLSVNSLYYLDNLNYYLAIYYLYSYIQNLLYINLNKVKSTCFKTRLKNTSFKTEINIDIETYIYKIIYLLIKRRREIFKIKENFNEQSSNNRTVKNLNVKH